MLIDNKYDPNDTDTDGISEDDNDGCDRQVFLNANEEKAWSACDWRRATGGRSLKEPSLILSCPNAEVLAAIF